tara:strand:- start:149 stop:379 length:231 start_codon:yes stop_codon:yes gene_type:complete
MGFGVNNMTWKDTITKENKKPPMIDNAISIAIQEVGKRYNIDSRTMAELTIKRMQRALEIYDERENKSPTMRRRIK